MKSKPTKIPKRIDKNPDEAVAEYAAIQSDKAAQAVPPAAGPGPGKPAGPARKAKIPPAPSSDIKIRVTKPIKKTLSEYRQVNQARIREAEKENLSEEMPSAESKSNGIEPDGRDRPIARRAGGSDGRKPWDFILPIDWWRR